MNSPTKIYQRQFLVGTITFILILTGSIILTRLTPWYNSRWDTILILLPVFPGIYAGLSLARSILTLDELQQRIQLEAFSFSLANTAFIALVLGLFQQASSMSINFVWVIPIMAVFWALGLHIAQRRFQ